MRELQTLHAGSGACGGTLGRAGATSLAATRLHRVTGEFRAILAPLRGVLATVAELEGYATSPLGELELHARMTELAWQLERASGEVRRGLALIRTGMPDPGVLGAEPVVPYTAELGMSETPAVVGRG